MAFGVRHVELHCIFAPYMAGGRVQILTWSCNRSCIKWKACNEAPHLWFGKFKVKLLWLCHSSVPQSRLPWHLQIDGDHAHAGCLSRRGPFLWVQLPLKIEIQLLRSSVGEEGSCRRSSRLCSRWPIFKIMPSSRGWKKSLQTTIFKNIYVDVANGRVGHIKAAHW